MLLGSTVPSSHLHRRHGRINPNCNPGLSRTRPASVVYPINHTLLQLPPPSPPTQQAPLPRGLALSQTPQISV